MQPTRIPDTVSHQALLTALQMQTPEVREDLPCLYRMNLRHSLLSLARRAVSHEILPLPIDDREFPEAASGE